MLDVRSWLNLGFFAVCAMCTCASPEVGGFQGGHGKIELLFGGMCALCPRCAHAVKHPHGCGEYAAPPIIQRFSLFFQRLTSCFPCMCHCSFLHCFFPCYFFRRSAATDSHFTVVWWDRVICAYIWQTCPLYVYSCPRATSCTHVQVQALNQVCSFFID